VFSDEKLMRSQHNLFQVHFWGVRGSYPTSGRGTLKYGGHTSCVEVQVGGHRLIFDAGTGIIELGEQLVKRATRALSCNVFLSHTHHDHISGFYFFAPLLRSSTTLRLFGPNTGRKSLRATLEAAMDSQFFPVSLAELDAHMEIQPLKGGEVIRLADRARGPSANTAGLPERETADGVTIVAHKSRAHPKNGVLLYRVTYRNRSMVYATDIEQKAGGWPDVIEFARGTDLLIHDAQYLTKEYLSRSDPRKGWGHSTVERAVETAQKAGAKRLLLFHHEPTHDDDAIRQIEKYARRILPLTAAAYEGLNIDLLR
jgi:phosphoribosyl 1,2-cyclic phosphodiesterase